MGSQNTSIRVTETVQEIRVRNFDNSKLLGAQLPYIHGSLKLKGNQEVGTDGCRRRGDAILVEGGSLSKIAMTEGAFVFVVATGLLFLVVLEFVFQIFFLATGFVM